MNKARLTYAGLTYAGKLFALSIFGLIISGCASSGAQRGAASEIDKSYISASYQVDHAGDGDIADTYQATSHATKGVLLGGVTGAAAGGLSSMGVVPGLLTGAIVGGAIGAYIDQYTTLTDKLEARGVKTIVLGDQVLIIIPSVVIFDPYTSNIRPTAGSTLDMVAELVNSYPNMSVKIAAYTSNGGSGAVNYALSAQQADNVEKYLWRRNINTRILTAAGYGGCNLVTKDDYAWNNANYRIEITLEKLPV